MQCDQIRKRLESDDGGYENSVEPIGFSLFSILANNDHLPRPFRARKLVAQVDSNSCQRIASSGIYLYKREINKKISLEPGSYVLVPSVFDKDVSLRYVLRVFYYTPNDSEHRTKSSSISIVKIDDDHVSFKEDNHEFIIEDTSLSSSSSSSLNFARSDHRPSSLQSRQSNICSIL